MSLKSKSKVLKCLRSSLSCPDYWQLDHQQWTVIGYYKKLIEVNPTVTRRTASGLFVRDLEQLLVAFISDRDVKKKVETLRSELKKSTGILADFWNKHSESLRKLALENSLGDTQIESALKRKAAISIVESCPNISKPKRTRYRKNKEEVIPSIDGAELVECDDVFVADSDLSVGTMIKRIACNLHEKTDTTLTCRERKIMTSGLSSILDLSDDSFESQRSLFTDEQWTELHARYDTKFQIERYHLDTEVEDCLLIVCNTLELSNDYGCVLKFIRKTQDRLSSSMSKLSLQIVECILNVTHTYQYLLSQPSAKNVTELDYYCTIWSPIFLTLFANSDHVHVKAGESINASSTKNKKEVYSSSHIKAFKIDVRFVVDMNSTEYDAAVGECAKSAEDNKAIKDEGKLTREAKDALDMVLNRVDQDVSTNIWIIQTCGASCSMSILNLFDNGLYIVNHKHSFSIPKTTAQFKNSISDILCNLLTMKREIEKLASHIISDRNHIIDISFNRESYAHKINPKVQYMRDTYYTPPRGTKSKIPHHLFGPPSRLNINSNIPRSVLHQKVSESVDVGHCQGYDLYGYKQTKDGKYYNKYTKKITDEHPMQ
ncbi:hypothetical protein A0J61_04912 [Choanephora cucurbitarum]|uniref:Uncharacterized protein n=1 Tax=Choanephora cucurbitarum TaxID=101091 RepID=A0A1C7NDK7_9FUNG|nr:hypothetical protein A0J61_04912 [Choanephora cucurbitarum]